MSNPTDRQTILYIHDEITAEEFTAASNVIEYAVPPGCKQTGGAAVTVVEAFDAATTDVIKVGTETADAGYIVGTTDLKTLGTTEGAAEAELGNYVPAGDKIVVTRTPDGAATNVGKVRVTVGYLVDGRGTETQD